MDRRDFLRRTSLSALGLSGFLTASGFSSPSSDNSPTGKNVRWGLAIFTASPRLPALIPSIVRACHEAHNVPDIPDKKQEIKWIWPDTLSAAFTDSLAPHRAQALEARPFLLLCNHCANPACVRVCPTGATFKREDGIVAMDYHRCIGCRFCMAACPYGARSFNFHNPAPYLAAPNPAFPARMRGVVEKCTFCSERLDQGLAPHCVEAAPEDLVFGNLHDPDSKISQILRRHSGFVRKPELGTEPSVYYIL